ncbi:MAG: ion transporter [Actinomycetaceae bacterium]
MSSTTVTLEPTEPGSAPTSRAGGGPARSPWRDRLGEWVLSKPVQTVVIWVILLNAVTLGLETSQTVMSSVGGVIHVVDKACLAVFIVEIAAKLVAFGPRFFRDGWNVFDFLVVAIALIPGSGALSVLRSLRVLRVLRLVSALPRLRFIVEALMRSLPGIGSIALLLGIIFYVSAVMATVLFGQDFPEYFGSLGDSLFTLFQVMTLESWAMGIVRPILEVSPMAWIFFVIFILAAAFTILNLFIAVIVDTMQTMGQERPDGEDEEEASGDVVGSESDLRARGGERAGDSPVVVGEDASDDTMGDRNGAVGSAGAAAGADRDSGAASAEQMAAVLQELRALRSQVDALQPK